MANGFIRGGAGNGARRSRIAYGKLSKTRLLLRRLPAELTAPIKAELKAGAEAIAADAKANAPRSAEGTRHAADAIRAQVGRDGFSAKVGLIGKRANRRGFYLKFFETGTKGTAEGFGRGIALPPQPARPWLAPAFDAQAPALREKLRQAIGRVINSVARGLAGRSSSGARIGVGDE